jgi:redox-sensitive bicupin YhaK (pirin superfamily)
VLRYIDHNSMGRGQHGWLDSYFHFSFAEYHNPENIQFGALRVVNDDIVQPDRGFDTHPHRDMEIVSYVVEGELSHKDSMGNVHTLTRGQTQYMSAGTGVFHSEYNHGATPLRFLQIWIVPDKKNYTPSYGDCRFAVEDRQDRWMPIATGYEDTISDAPIRLHQDVRIAAALLSTGKELALPVASGRQAYLVLIEGEARVDGIAMRARDAMEITEQTVILCAGCEEAHALVIEMARQ